MEKQRHSCDSYAELKIRHLSRRFYVMTVKELKDVLNLMDDDADVSICVNEPAGWVCPDGAVVGISRVCRGIDWHSGAVLIVPEYKLDIHDVDAWSGNKSIKKLKMPIDIKKFNEICEMSKGGLQTFKGGK